MSIIISLVICYLVFFKLINPLIFQNLLGGELSAHSPLC